MTTKPKRWEELSPEHQRAIVMLQDDRTYRGGRCVDDEMAAQAVARRIAFGATLTAAERAALFAIVDRLDAPYEPAMRLAQHEERSAKEGVGYALVRLFSSIAAFVARGVEGDGPWVIGWHDVGREDQWRPCGHLSNDTDQYTFANRSDAEERAAGYTVRGRATYSVRPLPKVPA